MKAYLLDTNHLTRLKRKHPQRDQQLIARIAALADDTLLYTSIINVGELWYGIEKAPEPYREQLRAETQQLLSEDITGILPIDEQVAQRWATMMSAVPKGQHMGGNDSWVAAQALAYGLTLLSSDPDFDVVGGLDRENWLT